MVPGKENCLFVNKFANLSATDKNWINLTEFGLNALEGDQLML